MKEMVGGCCVCSDERGWTENPLVYCDGAGCNVAVHQACYGIVTVPSGPWYCRKCESQENAARVRCELCPSRDGALKKTDINAWAHVVCALYIPEVRFGNVTTMEPIVLSQIPHERFNKTCYICDEAGKGSRASIGACMQCNKAGCKQQFHVTCAQSLGLLCEEAGNYLDNVKYCGYCQHHYSKLKKGGNVKTIPPYKPVNPDVSSDSSPEKELSDVSKPGPVKRKNSGKCSVVTTTSTSKPSKVTETLDSNRDNSNTSVTKFTTSNFVESVVTNSESVFGADAPVAVAPRPSPSSSAPHPAGKKRKSGNRTPTLPPDADPGVVSSGTDSLACRVVKTELVQPTEPDLAVVKLESHEKKSKIEAVLPPPPPAVPEPVIVSMKTASNSGGGTASGQAVVVAKSNVIASTGCAAPMPGIVVSVPLAAAPTSVLTTAPTLFQQLQQSIVANSNAINAAAGNTAPGVVVAAPPPSEPQPAKRRRSQSSDKPEKGRKNKRNCTPPTPASTPAPAVPAAPKRSSRSNLSTPTPPPAPIPPVHVPRGGHPAPVPQQPPPMTLKESPPSSPGSEAASASHGSRKNKKKNQRDQQRSEPKDVKIFSNGVSAPHMLGNQLNPSSNMSKKLSDALSSELEAHSVFTDSSTATSALVGPQLHSRVIASVRSGAAAVAAANSANNPLSMGLGAAFAATASGGGGSSSLAAIPQSLDQLLERQWEQGSQFLMEQAQHFDIASLLSCLHQLRAENLRLEEHVNTLLQRRDHLLAVNARLAIPLTTQPPGQVNNNVHPEPSPRGQQRLNNSYPPHPLENGLDSVLYPSPHRSPSTGPNAPTPHAAPPRSQGWGGASAPDNRRISNAPSGYPAYGVNATGPPQLSAATTQAIHAPRRDAVTDLHSMQSGKHS